MVVVEDVRNVRISVLHVRGKETTVRFVLGHLGMETLLSVVGKKIKFLIIFILVEK